MAKQINTRIQLKYDSYAKWEAVKETFKPLQGELCIVNPGTSLNDSTAIPCLMKVGDGEHFWKDLPWVSATAADVYGWAKQSENDFVKNFLTLKMTNGTTMQAQLDGVFATDAELSAAISGLRQELIAKLGVTSITSNGDADGVVTITQNNKAEGDVTLNVAHAKKGPTNGYTGGQTATTAQVGKEMTIKVPKLTVDAYGHTTAASDVDYKITIPQNVDTWRPVAVNGTIHLQKTEDTTLQIDDGSSIEVEWDDEDGAVVISHGAKPTTGKAEKATAGTGRTYVTEVLTDAYGHIAGVKTATETVVDTNTAHTHSVGDGLKQTGEGRTDGNVLTELNLAFVDDSANKLLKLVDANDNAKVIASFDTTDFIKDSFLKGATYDANTNTLTLQFLDNDDNTEDIEVDLSGLVDVYTADEKTLTKTTGTDGSAQFKIKAGGVGADEIAIAIKQEIAKGVSAYGWGNHANAGYAIADDLATVATSGDYKDLANTPDATTFLQLSLDSNYDSAIVDYYDSGVNFECLLSYNGKEVAIKEDIPTNHKTKQDAITNKITDAAHVLTSLTQNENGEISYEVKKLTASTLGVDSSSYLAISMDSETAVVDYYDTGVDIKNGLYSDGKVVATMDDLPKTTDDLVGGSEIWIINCGTSTTVI